MAHLLYLESRRTDGIDCVAIPLAAACASPCHRLEQRLEPSPGPSPCPDVLKEPELTPRLENAPDFAKACACVRHRAECERRDYYVKRGVWERHGLHVDRPEVYAAALLAGVLQGPFQHGFVGFDPDVLYVATNIGPVRADTHTDFQHPSVEDADSLPADAF